MTDFGPNAAAAVQFVQEGHNKFLAKADFTLQQALQQVAALSHFTTTGTNFTVDFAFGDQLAPFHRPVAPSIDPSEFNLRPTEQPTAPPGFETREVDVGTAPVYNITDPVLSFGARPTRPNMAIPTAPPTPGALTIPDEPDYPTPQPVTLLTMNLPVFNPVELPEFVDTPVSRPVFLEPGGADFTPAQYVSALLTKIQGRVSTWLDGQEALPAAIERALFDRSRARIVVETQAAVDQAIEEWGTRGFSSPSLQLAGRVDAIRAKGEDLKAELNRDVTLKAFDEALANMRLAVQSGIQLEGVTVNLFLEEQKMLLASAQYTRDTSIAILNARIALYNAEQQGRAIDAQVWKQKVDGELAKLEQIRLQIEAEKLKGDVNEQLVRQYAAQWDAVKAMASAYATRVEAYKAQGDLQRIPIEIFSEQTKAFGIVMDAYGKDVDAYRAGVEAENAKTTIHRNLVDAFATRTDAAVKFGGLQLDKERVRISEHGQLLEQYRAALQRADNLLNLERARISAVGEKVQAQATIYRAQGDIEQAASAATDRSFELGLAAARAKVDTQLETAKIRSQENIALQGLTLEALKALAQILSQLAASTMAAVNYSANVSASDSYSHSRNVSWAGEANDYTGPTTVD